MKIREIYFQKDQNVSAFEEDLIRKLLEADACISGNIKIEEIDSDELEYYDNDEDEEFIEEHRDDCNIYNVYSIVAGSWEQPLTLMAVDWCDDDEDE